MLRLRRKIKAEADAEFTLLSIGVLFQVGTGLVRSYVHIRGLYSLMGNRTHCRCELRVKVSSDAFIVRHISPGALRVAKLQCAGTDLVPIVASESGDVKRMQQAMDGRESALLKRSCRICKSLAASVLIVRIYQHARRNECAKHAAGQGTPRNRKSRTDFQQLFCRLFPQPERVDSSAARVVDPNHVPLQCELVGKGNSWGCAIPSENAGRIDCHPAINRVPPGLPCRVLGDKMIRLIVKQTIKTIRRKCRLTGRGTSLQITLNPS